jgi:hypothetical protein
MSEARMAPRVDAAARVIAKCVRHGKCLVWSGAGGTDSRGPQVRDDDQSRIHPARVLWRKKHGEVPVGRCLRRTCATRNCIAPLHHVEDDHSLPDSAVQRGSNHPRSKLTETSVGIARHRYNKGETVNQLATSFGVSISSMYRALVGQNWAHVDDPVKTREYRNAHHNRNPELWPK